AGAGGRACQGVGVSPLGGSRRRGLYLASMPGKGNGSPSRKARGYQEKGRAGQAAAQAARKARMRAGSFTPGRSSTPEEMSTRLAPLAATASARFSAVRPPDSSQGRRKLRPASSGQSNGVPLPPGSAPSRAGGKASNSSRSDTASKSAARSRSAPS